MNKEQKEVDGLNEYHFECPSCNRLNFRGSFDMYEQGEFVACSFCKQYSIVVSIKAYLKCRRPN